MASMKKSIHSITLMLNNVPCEMSLRYHLKKLSIEDLERANTMILTHFLEHVLTPGESYQFAIDYPHDPYYGTTSSKNEDYVIRSKLGLTWLKSDKEGSIHYIDRRTLSN
jgi:putative transposase